LTGGGGDWESACPIPSPPKADRPRTDLPTALCKPRDLNEAAQTAQPTFKMLRMGHNFRAPVVPRSGAPV
jgi:hypothetical protein